MNLRLRLQDDPVPNEVGQSRRAARWLLMLCAPSLKLLGARRTLGWLRWACPLARPGASRWEAVERIRGAVEHSRRLVPFRIECMERSVVIWALLRREGIPADIRVGLQLEEQVLRGHAWVEVEGRNVSERGDPGPAYASAARSLFEILDGAA